MRHEFQKRSGYFRVPGEVSYILGYGTIEFNVEDAIISFYPPVPISPDEEIRLWDYSVFPKILHLLDTDGRVAAEIKGCLVRLLDNSLCVVTATANSVLIFDFSTDNLPQVFTQLTAVIPGLREWTGFGMELLEQAGERISMKMKLAEDLDCEIVVSISTSSTYLSSVTESFASLKMSSPVAHEVDAWLDHVGWLSSMLSVCAGEACVFSKIRLEMEEETALIWVPKSQMDAKYGEKDPRFWPFTLKGEARLGIEIVERWWRSRPLTRILAAQLIENWMRPRSVSEKKFISLMQGIESYHRRAFKGSDIYLDPQEYAVLRDLVAKAIPPTTHPDLKAALGARLKFGNEHSLRNRLKRLLSVHPNAIFSLMSVFNTTARLWIDLVVNLRNEITHYSGSWEHFETERVHLPIRVRETALLCRYLLLFEMMGDPDAAFAILRKTDDFRDFFNLRLYDCANHKTWVYYKKDRVDLLWAKRSHHDLRTWVDYCPACGYISNDSKSGPGNGTCRHCGANSSDQADAPGPI